MSDTVKVPFDGGPAFPMPSGDEPRVNQTTHYNEGMSLLDYFAGQAMAACYKEFAREAANDLASAVATAAYEMADAMILERKRLAKISDPE